MIDTNANKELCLIHKLDLKGSQESSHIDYNLVYDPTMRRVKFTDPGKFCTQCGYNEAIYFVSPDSEDKYLKQTFICTRMDANRHPKCGHMWHTQPEVDETDGGQKAEPEGSEEGAGGLGASSVPKENGAGNI